VYLGFAFISFGSTVSPPSALSAPADTDGAVVARSQRRVRRRWFVAFMAVGVVVAWIGLAVFADDVGQGAAVVTASEGLPTPDSFGGDLDLSYNHDGTIVVTASVANRGWFPVTVTGAWMFPAAPTNPNDTFYLLLKQEQVLIEGTSSSLPADRDITDPVDVDKGSVTIPGGEELDISIGARFGDCDNYESGTGNTFEVLRIDYRHLGIPQTVQVPVRHVVVEAPEMCPID
jgi:hypothetical protein